MQENAGSKSPIKTGCLTLSEVTIGLGGRALLAISATIAPGEVLTIMGPSGSGKSTLLAFAGGFLDPAFDVSGRILIDGKDLTAVPANRRHAGILFQDPLLFPHLSVGGNIVFAIAPDVKDGAHAAGWPMQPSTRWALPASSTATRTRSPAARRRAWHCKGCSFQRHDSCFSTNPSPISTRRSGSRRASSSFPRRGRPGCRPSS